MVQLWVIFILLLYLPTILFSKVSTMNRNYCYNKEKAIKKNKQKKK